MAQHRQQRKARAIAISRATESDGKVLVAKIAVALGGVFALIEAALALHRIVASY